jgi:hypothetical protein
MKKFILLHFFVLIQFTGFGQSIPFTIKMDRLGLFYPDSGERIFINPGDSVILISFANIPPVKKNVSNIDGIELNLGYSMNDKSNTWKVIYKGAKGSISEAYLINNKEYREKFVPEIKPETEKEKHTRMIKNYGVVFADDILNKTIRLGQSEWVLKEILGKPDDINRTVGSFGTHEQWVYNKNGSKMKLYYFENHVLTGWQD